MKDFLKVDFNMLDPDSPGYVFSRIPNTQNNTQIWKVEIACIDCTSEVAKLTWFDGKFNPTFVEIGPEVSIHYIEVVSEADFVNLYIDNRDKKIDC